MSSPNLYLKNAYFPYAEVSPLDSSSSLQDAIRQNKSNKLESLLSTTAITAATLHALLTQAFQNKACSPEIKKLLTGHSQADPEKVFNLALQHDEVAVAMEMLKKVRVQPKHFHQCRSPAMRSVLTHVWRKNILYPGNAVPKNHTDLDRFLREDQFDQAGKTLASIVDKSEQFTKAKSLQNPETLNQYVAQLWAEAVEHRRPDVLRALLLFGLADQFRDFRLLEEQAGAQIEDAGVLAVMKEIPHYSPKRPRLDNFNGKAKGVVCRHLTYHRQARQAADPALKSTSYYADVQNVGAIQAKVAVSDPEIENMRGLSTEVHLVDNCKFGRFIAQQFDKMKREDITSMQMMLCSHDHAMSLELRMKKKEDGKPVYVAKFYDPNATTTHVRSASTTPEAFVAQDIGAYLRSDELKKQYFPDVADVSIIFVRPAEDGLRLSSSAQSRKRKRDQTDDSGRQLDVSFAPQVNAIVVHYLLRHGFAGTLRDLKEKIAKLEGSALYRLLAAKSPERLPGLYLALQEGHAEAVEAFGEVLQLLKLEKKLETPQLMELLVAKSPDKFPGIFAALQNGHAEAVSAFGEVLQLLELETPQLIELLAAKSSQGFPGLLIALQNGHAKAVSAFGEVLKLLELEKKLEMPQLMELLAAKSPDEVPGLFIALQEDQAEAVSAFGKVLKLLGLPTPQLMELLAAKSPAEFPGLFIGLQNGRAKAVSAFGEVLQLLELKTKLETSQLMELLAAKSSQRVPGLFMALEGGHAEAVKAFGKVLQLLGLPTPQLMELLAAKSFQRVPGLYIALEHGRADAVKAFGEVLQLLQLETKLETPQLMELLAAKSSQGVPALFVALQEGYTTAGKAYAKLLELAPEEVRAALLADMRAAIKRFPEIEEKFNDIFPLSRP